MKTPIVRHALSTGAAVAFLAACAGPQLPTGVSGAMNQAPAIGRATPSFRVLHDFRVYRGRRDAGAGDSLGGLLDVNNMLYGTASWGGDSGYCSSGGGAGCGVVFRVSPTRVYANVYRFPNAGGGAAPAAGLTNVGGTMYGTTVYGGSLGDGTVFRVTADGQEKTLYSFIGGADGANPWYGPLIYVKGKLYGTTVNGGHSDDGTVFEITTSGKEKVLHSFPGGRSNGTNPDSGLTSVNDTMYGTTLGRTFGTVYSITTGGKESVVSVFLGGAGGEWPHGVINVNGTLYGTASGGSYGHGIAYSMTTTGKKKILYNFAGGADGSDPADDLVEHDAILYGVTYSGGGTGCGGNGCGTIFSLTMSGTEKVLYSFTGGVDGSSPNSTLVNMNGVLYGTTQYGGGHGCTNGCGVVFALTP